MLLRDRNETYLDEGRELGRNALHKQLKVN